MDWVAENLHAMLDRASDAELDRLSYGVIGLEADGKVSRYSAVEAKMAGFDRDQVIGRHFFEEIGRCMNNSLVAGRFNDALSRSDVLDVTLDYVIAFRSQLNPVKLRLLSDPTSPVRYMLVQRQQKNNE